MNQYFALTSPDVTQMEKDHMALARELAGECMVLLENDGTLPLAGPCRIGLFGNGARMTVKGGTGSGDVNSREVITVEGGLEAAGFTIGDKGWMDRHMAKRASDKENYATFLKEKSKETGMPEMMITFYYPFGESAPVAVTDEDMSATDADTAIYVISRNSGEGADRFNKKGDYLPYDEEIENLKKLGAYFKHVILVLNIGGVMELTKLREIPGISAILLMSQLGNIGGHALADLLLGKCSPSGKLADTWAKSYEDYPSSKTFSHNNGEVLDDNYAEGIYVGYRYFETFGVKPLYSFGYGLSYTAFDIQTKAVEQDGDEICVKVQVTNTGDTYAGKEVVQLYVSAPAGSLDKASKSLVAFAKTKRLAPCESELLTLKFKADAMASYSEAGSAWILEKGIYVLHVGNSVDNTTVAAGLALDQTVVTLKCAPAFARDNTFEELKASAAKMQMPEHIVTLDPAKITQAVASYQNGRMKMVTDKQQKLTMDDILAGRCSVEELVAQLSVEELATLCVGTLRAGEEVVGNASCFVPGAAGDSTGLLMEERGIKGMIMADGPAGLRLQPHFKTNKAGVLYKGGSILGDTVEPFDPNIDPEDVIDYYQYCTAIPIGWALAQSWNSELLEAAGDMVGQEMEVFNVDLWLAPAMNIHRNPLCGRNFEYYSEDPLVSGKAAAAITRGVQKHPGKGTCIKHFALNNQEDERYFTNAHVSERAVREIYLRGFEIAVREARPLSLMTSYNLLNGIHTANRYDLIQSVLRDEWGFDGVVMTDWYTSQDMPAVTGSQVTVYPISASTGCVFAGNDIQMPGCTKNVTDLMDSVCGNMAIDGYKVTLEDLQYCAANVIRVAAKTTIR